MADLMQGLLQGMQNPAFGMGVGMLTGNQLGQGLQQGLMNAQAMQQMRHRQDIATQMMVQRTAELRARREQEDYQRQVANRIATQYGVAPGLKPGAKMMQAQTMGLQPGTQEYAEFMQPAPNVVINQGTGDAPPAVLNDQQVANAGLAPGTVAQVDNKGKINVVMSPEKQNAAYAKLEQVDDALTNYESYLDNYGTEILPTEGKLLVGAAYNNLMLEAKELYNLGVLQGPDLAIMEKVMKDPTALGSQLYSGSQLKEQLKVFGEKMKEARRRLDRQYGREGTTPQPPPGFTEPIR